MKHGSAGLIRAALAGTIILLSAASAHSRDDHPQPSAQPVLRNAAAAKNDRAGEVLQLDLGCGTADGNRLLRLLSRDRIRVVWADTGDGGEMTVRVTMTVARFTTIFKGELVKREVARSSYDGYATEQFLERYVIPKKYKGSLRWVRLPDPQLE